MSNSNIVKLLTEACSALHAIAKTYDDHELRARALEVYESTAPEVISGKADCAVSAGWSRLTEGLPDPDRYPRVLIYTEGMDFNGEQFFDVKADTLDKNSSESSHDQPEICRAATHWMPRPFLDENALLAARTGQWVHCSPALLQAGVSCAHTPRRSCKCRPESGGHDHFIAFNVAEASNALHDEISSRNVVACLHAHADAKSGNHASWVEEVSRRLSACRLNDQAATGMCAPGACGKRNVRPAGNDPTAAVAPSSPCARCVSWGYCAGHGCMALPGTDVGTAGPPAS